MSKPWKPAKKTVELQAEVRPSRIRRDPLRVADGADRKAYWRSAEWDRKFAVVGITLFALAIFIVTVGFSAITGAGDGAPAPNLERFGSCEGGPNCVIDGDTVRVAGETVRIAGIEAPAIQSARCPDEQRRGIKAVERLTEILNSGKVGLGDIVREADGQLGTKVEVDGRDIAPQLISAGLARTNDGTKPDWCS